MNIFYTTDIRAGLATLHDQEAVHCGRVLRHKEGDEIHITDGKGHLWDGIITSISKKNVTIQISESPETQEPKTQLAIGICPTKTNGRLEWFLEKATEIGISEIFLIRSQRTEKTSVKMHRLQGILEAAMKQSYNLYLPKIHDIRPFSEVITSTDYEDRFIGHCMEPTDYLLDVCRPQRSTCVLIGPEGDFTQEELSLAYANNYVGVSLGKSRYRTETAGILATHLINIKNV